MSKNQLLLSRWDPDLWMPTSQWPYSASLKRPSSSPAPCGWTSPRRPSSQRRTDGSASPTSSRQGLTQKFFFTFYEYLFVYCTLVHISSHFPLYGKKKWVRNRVFFCFLQFHEIHLEFNHVICFRKSTSFRYTEIYRDYPTHDPLIFGVAQGIFWLSAERVPRSILHLKDGGTLVPFSVVLQAWLPASTPLCG